MQSVPMLGGYDSMAVAAEGLQTRAERGTERNRVCVYVDRVQCLQWTYIGLDPKYVPGNKNGFWVYSLYSKVSLEFLKQQEYKLE